MLRLRETHMSGGYSITVEIQLLVKHKSATSLRVLSLVLQTCDPKGKELILMQFWISHLVTLKSKPSLPFSYKTGSLSQGRVCKSQNNVGAPMWATYNLTAITCHCHDFSLGVLLPLTIVFMPPSLHGVQEILLNSGSWITIFSVNEDWLSLLQISLNFWNWYTQQALHVRTEPISTSPSFRGWEDRSTSLHRMTLLTSCGPKKKHSHLLPVPSMSLNSVFTQQVIMVWKGAS